MSNTYLCPHCKASLNPGNKVILRLQRGRKKGLVLLSPQVGNYRTILPEGLELQAGDRVQLSCPVCEADLTSPVNRHLCHVLRRADDGELLRVYFSKTYGEHATFVVHEDQLRSYGDDAGLYEGVNFFGAGGRAE